MRTFSLARKTNILTFKKKERVYALCALHACNTQYTAPVYGRVHGFETFSSLYVSFFLFVFLCLFVCLFFFLVLFCFVLFFSVLLFFPSFFSAFRCLSTGRGLVPMLSFPKNAGIVKLLMPSETGRRPRSSMLSSAGNA